MLKQLSFEQPWCVEIAVASLFGSTIVHPSYVKNARGMLSFPFMVVCGLQFMVARNDW